MKNLFFYGTLAHLPLLEVVLGHPLATGQASAATLPGFATFWVAGQAYPMLAAQQAGQKGADAKGLYVTALSDQDLARLDFYEGGFGYDLQQLPVQTKAGTQQAEVYFPAQTPARGAVWDLADWQDEWAEMTLQAADEAMGYFGQISAKDLARRFGAIRSRAASYIRGQAEMARKAAHDRTHVTVLDKRTPYSNFYAVQEYDLRHRRFNGEISPQIERGVFIAYDAAIVLPYDPVRDCVLLVEQFRIGAMARGAKQPWLLEPVAGHVDVGETPEQAAQRETIEEAGVHLRDLIPIAQAYPSPGNSTEYYYLYLGLCDLEGAGGRVAGLADEDEDIHSHILSYDALMEYVTTGGANVLPLVTAAYWLAINRERLRQGA